MRETSSYVQKLMGVPAREDEPQPEWRSAFVIERESTAQSFSLSVRPADGRSSEGFPMSLYVRHKWLDRNARLERLILLFSNGAIYVEGQHLQRALDAIEDGKLKRIQVQDSNEIAAIRGRNADVRKAEDKVPIVSRAVVSPPIELVLEEEESLKPIAQAMEEDHAHYGRSDK